MQDEYYHNEEEEELVGGQESPELGGHPRHHLLVFITNRHRGSSVSLGIEVIASPEGHSSEIEKKFQNV